MTATLRLSALLKITAFRRIWLVGLCTSVARWLDMLVVGVFAFETTGSPFLVALLAVLRFAPLAIFGPIVGTYADRLRPRLLLGAGLWVAVITSGTVAVLFFLDVVAYWHVALATFISGLIWATDLPVRRRMLGDAAGDSNIATAMSLDSASNNATRMIGPLLGGGIYYWLGAGGAFALSAALFVIAALILLRVAVNRAVGVPTEPLTRVLKGFQEAAVYAYRDRNILCVLLVTIVFNVWGFSFLAMVPVIGGGEFGLNAGWVGVLVGVEGAGAFCGALLVAFNIRSRGFRQLFFFGTISHLTLVFVASWLGDAVPFAVLLFLIGVAAAGFTTMQSTLVFTLAPPEMRGRLLGLVVLCIGAGLVGNINTGLMGELFGGSMAIRIIAIEGLIPMIAIGFYWRELWKRAPRQL